MTSDNERREVARRLRALDYSDLQESLICAYLDALGIDGYEDWVGIARRLADLIEPSCDRDALMELADEMIATAKEAESIGFLFNWRLYDFANRIREALGAQDA